MSTPPPPASPVPAARPNAITAEALATLPIRRFDGPVHQVDSEADLQRAFDTLRREQVIGFDTETRPAFRKGQSYLPSLVQMAGSHAVYLFRPQQSHVVESLRHLLEDSTIVKTGVAVADDLRKLRELFPFEERQVIDLGEVAKRQGIAQSGVRNLVGLFLGWRVTKGARTSNWARPRLSASQVTYAATDAWACRELYLHFHRLGWMAPGHG